MNIFLIAAPLALASSSVAHGRTAEFLDFTLAKLPISGVVGHTREESFAAHAPGVGEAMTAFAAETSAPEPSDEATVTLPTAGIQIPSWMKGTGKTSRFFTGAFRVAAAFPAVAEGCTREAYRPNPRLHPATESRRARYYSLVAAVACEASVPTHLLDALVTQESRYDPSARSPKGAIGLAQLMPGTARQLGIANPWNTVENLRGGARYLRAQLNEFKRYDLALGAYNAGPARIRQYGRVPEFRETLGYVSTILRDVRWAVGQGASFESKGHRPAAVRTAMLVEF